jgi:hypothetical protein
MADQVPVWISITSALAGTIGGIAGGASLVWQWRSKSGDRKRALRDRLNVETTHFGSPSADEPQIWNCRVTFSPEDSGEAYQLEASVARGSGGSLHDREGPMLDADKRLRHVIIRMGRPGSWMGPPIVQARLLLFPADGAEHVTLKLLVRRVADRKRIVSRTLHTGPVG